MVAVAGCSHSGRLAEQQQAQELWTARQQALSILDSWDVHARAAIKLEGAAYNVGIRWQRQADKSTILLEAPFGQGVIRIESGADGTYQLRLPDGRVFVRDSAETLLEDMIGWSLPVSGLGYWIRGLPRPESAYTPVLDPQGRARSISQDQWMISYIDYFAPDGVRQLPRRVRLVSDQVTFKMIIERWQPPETAVSPSDLFPDFN